MKISQIANRLQGVEAQKENARNILIDVSKNFEYALIAGGAPRNWAYNRLANDFDIYVCRKVSDHMPEQREVDENIQNGIDYLSDIYGSLGDNLANKQISSNPYGGLILSHLYNFQAKSISSVGFSEKEKQNCQLIIIDDYNEEVVDCESFADRIFKTYDFGICMTSMDKDGNFYNSPIFESDKENKTFTVNIKQLKRNNQAGMEKLVERFNKMEKYFPDHKMRISY